MSRDWKKLLGQIAVNAEEKFDKAKHKIKERLDLYNPVQIVAYYTFGLENTAHFKGRVLEDKKIGRPQDTDSTLVNMWNMYRRMESDEIAGAVVEIKFQGTPHIVATDEEGYFDLTVQTPQRMSYLKAHYPVEVKLKSSPVRFEGEVKAASKVFVPSPAAEFGIISDIDDTIIETGATDFFKMMKSTFTKNALTRLPFEGAHAFYRALCGGKNGTNDNPFFYVSSSPWNLYDFLLDFIQAHKFPEGPLMLRDIGVDKSKFFSGSHQDHKYAQISRILTTYHSLPFILIGDSGQEDAAIYRKVAEDFPGRILTIYIRDVKLPQRTVVVKDIFSGYSQSHTPMLIVESSLEAAEHAIKRNFIPASALPSIRGEKNLAEQTKRQNSDPS